MISRALSQWELFGQAVLLALLEARAAVDAPAEEVGDD